MVPRLAKVGTAGTMGGEDAAPTNDKTRIGAREFVRSTRITV